MIHLTTHLGKDVPDCLKDLTDLEEQMISLTKSVIQVRYIRGGQIRYQDHVCNFVQHVEELPPQLDNLPQHLPRRPSDLDIVLIRHTGVDLSRHIDFKVRKTHIRDALHYLCQNNPQYCDVVIDDDRIEALPDDGSIVNEITTIESQGTHRPETLLAPGPSQSVGNADDEPEDQIDMHGGVLNLTDDQPEAAVINDVLRRCAQSETLPVDTTIVSF